MREAIHTMDDAALARVPLRLHDLAQRRRPPARATTACRASRSTRPRITWAATATTATATTCFYAGRLDRAEAARPGRSTRMKRVRSGARLKIAGAGPLEERAAQADRGPGHRGSRGAARLRHRRRADRRSTPAAARPTTHRSTRTTATSPSRPSSRASRSSPPRTPAGRSSSSTRRRDRRRDRARPGGDRRRHRPAVGAAARRGCARWARRATRGSQDITWDHVIDTLTASSMARRVKLARLEPAARRRPPASPTTWRSSSPAWTRRLRRDADLGASRQPAETAPTGPASDLDVYHLGNSPASRLRLSRGPAPAGSRGAPRLEPAPSGAPRDGGARRRVRPTCARCAEPTASKGHLRRPPGRPRAGRRSAAGALPAQRPRARGQPGVVGLTEYVRSPRRAPAAGAARAAPAAPPRRCRSTPFPRAEQARRALGLPEDALLVTSPGLATAAKRLDVAVRAAGASADGTTRPASGGGGGRDPGLALEDWARRPGSADGLLVTGRFSLERLRAPSLRGRRGARPALPFSRRDLGRAGARAGRGHGRRW